MYSPLLGVTDDEVQTPYKGCDYNNDILRQSLDVTPKGVNASLKLSKVYTKQRIMPP
jgi:hypothetical protein